MDTGTEDVGDLDGKDDGRLVEEIGVIVSVGADIDEVLTAGTADVLAVVAAVEYNDCCCCCCVTMTGKARFFSLFFSGENDKMKKI